MCWEEMQQSENKTQPWEKQIVVKEREKAQGIDVLKTLYCSLLPLFRGSLTPELGL
jgi:hypothetical protein